MKIIYMGTPDFAVKPLEALKEAGYEMLLAVTQPDKPKNRGKKTEPTPVKQAALALGIPVAQPETLRNAPEFLQTLSRLEPDLIVVAAYGKILPEEILRLPRLGCINIHASLLPRLRGAAPIQRAILEGDKTTGVTIMQMEKGLDTGDMLAEEELVIGSMNAQQLHDALSELGAGLLLKTLPQIQDGTVVRVPQDESLATYAQMITKETGRMDFSQNAEALERQVRALRPWPGAYAFYKGVMMKVKQASVVYQSAAREPGTILKIDEEGMQVACGRYVLNVQSLQFPGKKAMSPYAYSRGNDLQTGEVLKTEESQA